MESSSKKSKYAYLMGWLFMATVVCLWFLSLVRDGIITSKSGINLLVVGDEEVAILVVRPEQEVYNWIVLPKGLKVGIYDSDADYPLSSLWEYGLSVKKPIEVVEKSLGLSMGVVLPRMIRLGKEVSVERLSTSLLWLSTKTDLSVRDRFFLRRYLVEALLSKRVMEMDIPVSALDKVIEPDGREFLRFNQVMSLWTKAKFLDEGVLNEDAEVRVNNLTGVKGRGSAVARQMEAAGLRVVEVTTDPTENVTGKGCQFRSLGEYKATEWFVKHHLGCRAIKDGLVTGEQGISVWLN